MKIKNINYTNLPVNCRQQMTKSNGNINFTHKPMQEGINTAGAWFAFGVGLDIVSRKCNFFKSPTKNSLAINGIIGAAAGLITGFCASKKSKIRNK